MTAREELTKHYGSEGDGFWNPLMDKYRDEVAHELAETIRESAKRWDQSTATGKKRYWSYLYAADLIDPQAGANTKEYAGRGVSHGAPDAG